jgi:hypothetical protein
VGEGDLRSGHADVTDIPSEQVEALKKLRDPFPPETVNKLPKVPKSLQQNSSVNKSHCDTCGGYHKQGPGVVHLDYVGHAWVTDRLLAVDPMWSWEPYAHDSDGSPALERDDQGRPMGMWIKLTIAGMTRPGYGSVDFAKSDAVKELIGDAIRNAAMRFGVAIDYWKKDTGSSDDDDEAPTNYKARRSSSGSGVPDWAKEIPDSPARIVAAARKIDNTVTSIGDLASFTDAQQAELIARLQGRSGETKTTDESDRGYSADKDPDSGDPPSGNDLASQAAGAVADWGEPRTPEQIAEDEKAKGAR